jgi:hypothetical protein
VSLSSVKGLPGQKVLLETLVLRYLDAVVDWDGPVGKEVGGFKVEKVIKGAREVFPASKGFEVQYLTIVVSPKSAEFEQKEISGIAFPFAVDKRKGSQRVSLVSKVEIPLVKFEIVPMVARLKFSRDAVSIGDAIGVSLELLFYKGVQRKTKVERLSFKPFKKLPSLIRASHRETGNLVREVYDFDLYIYELPATLSPDLSNLYGLSYELPVLQLEIEYQGKKFTIPVETINKEVRFVPNLGLEELGQPLSTAIYGDRLISSNKYGLLLIAAGIVLLCASLAFLMASGVFATSEARSRRKERKRLFRQSRVVLRDAVAELSRSVSDCAQKRTTAAEQAVREQAGKTLLALQDFLGFAYPLEEGAEPRARTISQMRELLPQEDWLGMLDILETLFFSETIEWDLAALAERCDEHGRTLLARLLI